jgi:uncharacterized protein (TIGR02145 family)
MAENLNTGRFISASYGGGGQTNNNITEKYCYDYSFSNCKVYGGLYEWDEMMDYNPQENAITGTTQGICPIGWHIPTMIEVWTLEDNAGGNLVGGGNLKETGLTHWNGPNTGATNLTGFDAIPGGIWDAFHGNFGGLGWESYFYASSTDPEWGPFGFHLVTQNSFFDTFFSARNGPITRDGRSVRCVMDTPKK